MDTSLADEDLRDFISAFLAPEEQAPAPPPSVPTLSPEPSPDHGVNTTTSKIYLAQHFPMQPSYSTVRPHHALRLDSTPGNLDQGPDLDYSSSEHMSSFYGFQPHPPTLGFYPSYYSQAQGPNTYGKHQSMMQHQYPAQTSSSCFPIMSKKQPHASPHLVIETTCKAPASAPTSQLSPSPSSSSSSSSSSSTCLASTNDLLDASRKRKRPTNEEDQALLITKPPLKTPQELKRDAKNQARRKKTADRRRNEWQTREKHLEEQNASLVAELALAKTFIQTNLGNTTLARVFFKTPLETMEQIFTERKNRVSEFITLMNEKGQTLAREIQDANLDRYFNSRLKFVSPTLSDEKVGPKAFIEFLSTFFQNFPAATVEILSLSRHEADDDPQGQRMKLKFKITDSIVKIAGQVFLSFQGSYTNCSELICSFNVVELLEQVKQSKRIEKISNCN